MRCLALLEFTCTDLTPVTKVDQLVTAAGRYLDLRTPLSLTYFDLSIFFFREQLS